MPLELDTFDQQLLNTLQTEIPLVPRPFAEIARKLSVEEMQVLARLEALKTPRPGKRGIIRQISAIFDSKGLGYQSTLVAAMVDPLRLDAAAEVINQHPGVSHNYRRNHAFNLWYTLAVPPDSALGLEKTLQILHEQSGANSTRMLPTIRLFKIGVKFDLSGDADLEARSESAMRPANIAAKHDLTPADKVMIRILQQDLPIVPEPFAAWAQEAGVSAEELLVVARGFLDRKLMRRFSAVLRHREVGISANAMGVWAVEAPEERQERFGNAAASFAAVSHCYLRRSYPDWPYTIFTMVHAPTKEQCEAVLESISKATGVEDYAALYSTKEFKKVRVKYFTPEIPEWEKAHAGSR